MRLRFSAIARVDRAAAAAFLRREAGSIVAKRFLEELRACLAGIAERPRQWPCLQGLPDVRFARVRGFPYYVPFRITPNGVQILAVAHDRREPTYWEH